MAPIWKEDVPAAALFQGMWINGFFTANALVDYSVDIWAAADKTRFGMAATYYVWRAEAPIISYIFMALTLPLPFILIGAGYAAIQTVFGLRKATLKRHVGDLVQFAGLAFLLPYIIMVMLPAQSALADLSPSCGEKASKAALGTCGLALDAVTTPHLVILLLNVMLLAADAIKYNGNAGEKEKAA